jgi:hypothetical protein
MTPYDSGSAQVAGEEGGVMATSQNVEYDAPRRGWSCQNGGDVCLAGNRDGICCPHDSCDIDDGVRPMPSEPDTQVLK